MRFWLRKWTAVHLDGESSHAIFRFNMRNWIKPAKYSGTVSYPLSDLHSSGPSNGDTAVSAQVRVEYYATHEAHTHPQINLFRPDPLQ